MFKIDFDRYVVPGDSITCEVDGLTATATLHPDHDTTPPDQRQDGFWPSLDPKDPGYIGPKSKRTLQREHARMQHVMDSWKRDEWHYYGVDVTVSKNGIQLTDDFAHALWGIEGNWPSRHKRKNTNAYFRDVANDLLGAAIVDAKAKIAGLCAA